MRSMSTNKTGTIITGAAALAVTAGLAVTTVGAASAATLPTKPLPRAAYGSVELACSSPSRSWLFRAPATTAPSTTPTGPTRSPAPGSSRLRQGRTRWCSPIRAASTPTP